MECSLVVCDSEDRVRKRVQKVAFWKSVMFWRRDKVWEVKRDSSYSARTRGRAKFKVVQLNCTLLSRVELIQG